MRALALVRRLIRGGWCNTRFRKLKSSANGGELSGSLDAQFSADAASLCGSEVKGTRVEKQDRPRGSPVLLDLALFPVVGWKRSAMPLNRTGPVPSGSPSSLGSFVDHLEYELRSKLAEGGMGTIYRASQ